MDGAVAHLDIVGLVWISSTPDSKRANHDRLQLYLRHLLQHGLFQSIHASHNNTLDLGTYSVIYRQSL